MKRSLTDAIRQEFVAWPKPSPIAGCGLFALRAIAEDEKILRWPPVNVSEVPFTGQELRDLLPPAIAEWVAGHFNEGDGKTVLVDDCVGRGLMPISSILLLFINAATDANLVGEAGNGECWLRAVRNIAEGEELTLPYDWRTMTLRYYL